MRRRAAPLTRTLPLLGAAMLSVALAFGLTRASVSAVTREDATGRHAGALPLRLTGQQPAGVFTVSFVLRTGPLHPRAFNVQPDDCLLSLTIDGAEVPFAPSPYCDYAKPLRVELPALGAGAHRAEAAVRNDGGEALFAFAPSSADPAVLAPRLLFAVLLGLGLVLFLLRRGAPEWVWQSSLLVGGAVLLRALYVSRTPYWVRGHDTDGHIEYVRYLLEHLALPPPGEGWEFWQPPLYYLASALWWGAGSLAGFAEQQLLGSLQWMAFLLSVATLLLAWGIGLTAVREKATLPVWLLPFCALPSLVFLSARINNDVLVVPLTFLCILLLALWRKHPSLGLWIAAGAVAGLAVLSKNTALLLVPVACAFLAVHRWKRFWHPLSHALLFVAVIVGVSGWFSAYRMLHTPEQRFLVGNTGTLNSGLAVATGPEAYLTFNPAAMMRLPFNNAWSDAERRSNFFEYLYRSAWFGEFGFGQEYRLLASALVGLGLLVLAAAVAGAAAELLDRTRRRDAVLWLLVAGVFLLGHTAFRARYPFSSSQDFRYSLPLLVPLAYFLAAAKARAGRGTRAAALGALLSATVTLAVLFVASL